MRIYIEQKCEPDPHGLDKDHEDYEAYHDGAVKAYQVTTRAIDLNTNRHAEDALFGISVASESDDYLRTVKAEQLVSVLNDLGYDLEVA